jgi:hypothetical protein
VFRELFVRLNSLDQRLLIRLQEELAFQSKLTNHVLLGQTAHLASRDTQQFGQGHDLDGKALRASIVLDWLVSLAPNK